MTFPNSPKSRDVLLLEVSDLHVRHGRHPALSGVSLEVAHGSTTTIVGSQGAGNWDYPGVPDYSSFDNGRGW